MNAKHKKLANQFKFNVHKEITNAGESTDIFQGVSIYVNGYTSKTIFFLTTATITTSTI